jgi:hypothetical protein
MKNLEAGSKLKKQSSKLLTHHFSLDVKLQE